MGRMLPPLRNGPPSSLSQPSSPRLLARTGSSTEEPSRLTSPRKRPTGPPATTSTLVSIPLWLSPRLLAPLPTRSTWYSTNTSWTPNPWLTMLLTFSCSQSSLPVSFTAWLVTTTSLRWRPATRAAPSFTASSTPPSRMLSKSTTSSSMPLLALRCRMILLPLTPGLCNSSSPRLSSPPSPSTTFSTRELSPTISLLSRLTGPTRPTSLPAEPSLTPSPSSLAQSSDRFSTLILISI